MDFYSPLRYPGGKGKIASFVKLLFESNNLVGGSYVEPYAGGASVALSLLFHEYCSKIYINDLDRSIYCFWYSVLNHTEELCKKIYDTPLSVDEWRFQRKIQKDKQLASPLDLGFSTFYQNRCNRSGIISAGVIGGLEQNGKWKIDARFNKIDLIARIQRVARYKNSIILHNKDACRFISSIEKELCDKTLIYFDPPYYIKGKALYVNHYQHDDHKDVSQLVTSLKHKWIVSYDDHDVIRKLYSEFRQHIYSINYSASKANKGSEVIIFSDDLSVPTLYENLKMTAQLSVF